MAKRLSKLVKVTQTGACIVCAKRTRYANITTGAYFCSEACLDTHYRAIMQRIIDYTGEVRSEDVVS